MTESTKLVTSKLLEKQVLHCAYCNDLLMSTPIMLVENTGNVCSTCHEDNFKNTRSLRNSALETVVSILQFPCRYKEKGCDQWLLYNDLSTHEDICKHRSKLCPMFRMANCTWEGFPSEFIVHFLNNHGDHVINFENNLFFLQTSIAERQLIKLLVMRNHIFVLRMQTNLEKNRLFYMICNVRDETNTYDYSVKHKGNSDNCIKTKSRILTSNYIYNNFDENLAVNVDLGALKQTVKVTDTITNIFKIKINDNITNQLEERMLQYFECPVCKSFMKPPIYQCHSGHSVCNICKPRLEKCPTCRAMYGCTRNYSLEGLTSGVQYPCAYHDLGCTETFLANDISKHEGSCPYKPYNCPLPTCSLTGSQDVIINHLQEFHADQVILSDSQGYTESFRLEQHSLYNQVFDRKILLAFDHIFRLTCKRISDYCLWAAEIVSARDVTKNFVYEVSIIDMRRPEKKLIRTDYCLNEMSDDELFKRCIMFPNSILSSYSSNGMVSFHFKIKQK